MNFESTNYGNFARLQQTIKESATYWHEPKGNVTDLSKKYVQFFF